MNAIRAVAFILEEMEEVEKNRGIREVITTELTELGNDLKLFIEDTTKKIDTHLDKKLVEVDSAIGKITKRPRQQWTTWQTRRRKRA